MYDVLTPARFPTGEVWWVHSREGGSMPLEWYRMEWRKIGRAIDMEDAKKRYGGSPVLSPVFPIRD